MSVKETFKKFYNILDKRADGLIIRIVAASGLSIILAGLIDLITGPCEKQWMTTIIFSIISIPIGIGFIIIKPISIPIASIFKVPSININVYIITVVLIVIFLYATNSNIQSNAVFFYCAILISLLLKTPFLPKCKLKTIQEKTEKTVIIISLTAFIINISVLLVQLVYYLIIVLLNA